MEITIGIYSDGSRSLTVHRHNVETGERESMPIAAATWHPDGSKQMNHGLDVDDVHQALMDAFTVLAKGSDSRVLVM